MQIHLLSVGAVLFSATPGGISQRSAATRSIQFRATAERLFAGSRQTVSAADGRPIEVRARSNRGRLLRESSGESRSGSTIRNVELTGTLLGVDRERELLRVQTDRGPRPVELFDETEYLPPLGGRSRLDDLRKGEAIRIRGEERNGRILAHQVELLGLVSPDPNGDAPRIGSRAVITGTVRTPTHLVSRKVKVRTADRDVTVDAGQDTRVTQYDERISVHELKRGDRVRIEGVWTGEGRLRAARIDVGPQETDTEATRGYRSSLPHTSVSVPAAPKQVITVTGFLVSHDEDRDRMRLSTRNGDRIVVANGTPAFLDGERISRREIRQGDRVRASGYWNGREIMATRVELAY